MADVRSIHIFAWKSVVVVRAGCRAVRAGCSFVRFKVWVGGVWMADV